jgi:drug/metabolite transporter (DMT)-like permease
VSIVLAIAAMVAFGVGMTLQQQAARQVPFEEALRLSVIQRLMFRRVWLAGVFVSGLGFLLQIAALHGGSVVLVSPIVTSALVVCLALTSWWDKEPLGRARWVAIGCVVVGISVFLELGHVGDVRSPHISGTGWVVGSVLVAAVTLACCVVARTAAHTTRAVAVGAAAGIGNAYASVLARVTSVALGVGLVHGLSTWYPYALLAVALFCVVLVQAIYQAGQISVSLPIATVSEAGISVVLGLGMLHERAVFSGVRGAGAVVGLVVALGGLASIGRSEAALLEHAGRPT